MAYGVKANVKAPHKFLRMGGVCWVMLTNPGWGGAKVMVRGTSRGGRKVDTWVDSRDLQHFRVGWFSTSEEYRFAIPFASREEAKAWADDMNLRFGEQPVRTADLARTREVLAAMLGPVTIGRDSATGENYAELEEPAERLLLAAVGESLGMVAGGRNSSRRRVILG